MLSYCVKCREKTKAKKGDSIIYIHQNGRYRLSEVCIKCDKNKNVFINSDMYKKIGSPVTEMYVEKPRRARKKHKKKDQVNSES